MIRAFFIIYGSRCAQTSTLDLARLGLRALFFDFTVTVLNAAIAGVILN